MAKESSAAAASLTTRKWWRSLKREARRGGRFVPHDVPHQRRIGFAVFHADGSETVLMLPIAQVTRKGLPQWVDTLMRTPEGRRKLATRLQRGGR